MGDIVILNEDGIVPMKWPLARVAKVHPGSDGFIRVATVKTAKGSYNRPVSKISLLLPNTSLVRSDTAPRCTAFTERDTIHKYTPSQSLTYAPYHT